MKQFRRIVLLTAFMQCHHSFSQCASDVFFSRYIEGSGNNKAIEIFNGTEHDVDLSNYQIDTYYNGSTSVGFTILLSGTLCTEKTYLIAHSEAHDNILRRSDQEFKLGWFNGNDAVVLRKVSGDIVDVIGKVGEDPGEKGWKVDVGSTTDHTLVRKAGIGEGTADWGIGKGQWLVFAKDHFDGLGNYAIDCSPLPVATLGFKYNIYPRSIGLCWDVNANLRRVYEVEHSIDGKWFNGIGFLENGVHGDCNQGLIHLAPESGENYYRLSYQEQGSIVYSQIVKVVFQNPKVSFYPNPFSNSLYVSTNIDSVYYVRIFTLAGEEVVFVESDKQCVELGEGLCSGKYLLNIYNEDFFVSDLIIKY